MMRPPFPGMDPWLEDPALWPDVHNSLIAAIRDAMAPLVAPKYYIGLETRTYQVGPEGLPFVGVPDVSVLSRWEAEPVGRNGAGAAAVEVEALLTRIEEMRETFLEVRDASNAKLVTLIELLSPANKYFNKGRKKYVRKVMRVLETRTNLVEVDLLRGGRPMPWYARRADSDYLILVSPRPMRPNAMLYRFNLRDPIPTVSLPLLPGDPEPPMELNAILHGMVERARYDLRLRYDRPASPPLGANDAEWARAITG